LPDSKDIDLEGEAESEKTVEEQVIDGEEAHEKNEDKVEESKEEN
jgi:hypothetical protein